MTVTTVVKTIGTTGTFSTVQLWEDGAPADLTTSNKWTAATFVGTFIQGETVTGAGITGGKFLDSDGATYITFGTTTTPAAGITVTGSTSLATCIISGAANVGVIWQGQCQNQVFSNAGITLNAAGSTSSTTCYKEITTVAGASFRDNANAQTNALAYNGSNGCGFTGAGDPTVQATENNFRMSKIQCYASAAGARALTATGTTIVIDNAIFEASHTGASGGSACCQVSAITSIVKNVLVVQRGTGADHIFGGSASLYNCTFAASDDLATAPVAVIRTSGNNVVQNCGLFAGDSTKAIVVGTGVPTFTTSYSDISGTTGVTQTTYANEFQNVNDATHDFRIKTGAAQINTGTTDGTNAPTDIVGTARPQGASYDIGCWELIAAAAFLATPNRRSTQAIKRAAFY